MAISKIWYMIMGEAGSLHVFKRISPQRPSAAKFLGRRVQM